VKRIAIILPLTLCLCWVGYRSAGAQTAASATQQSTPTAKFENGGNAAEVAAAFIDHLVFVPVRVNQGEPSLFELNTGARKSSIDPSRANELRLGAVKSAVLNLSGLDVSFSQLAETSKANFAALLGRPYQGTLGNDFLATVVAEVDYARETMQLYDPDVYKYTGRGKGLRVTLADGLPVVKAKAVIEGRGIDGDFVVNTALDAPVLIFQKYADAHRLSLHKPISAASMPIEGAEEATLGRLGRFQIGPYAVEAALVVFSRENPPVAHDARLAGEIGAEMLRRFGVVFDYPRQQIFFAPNSEFNSEDFEDMSGLTVTAGGPNLKKFQITDVRPYTPGSDAGLRKGDIIEGINGDAAADLSLADIRALFRQLGSPLDLVITRNGKTVKASLQMHRLL
jgi:PDZ domain